MKTNFATTFRNMRHTHIRMSMLLGLGVLLMSAMSSRSQTQAWQWYPCAPVVDRLPDLSIGAMVIDPSNPKVLYAGSNDDRHIGLFKTEDGGKSWKLAKLQIVRSITLDPTNPAAVYLTGGILTKSLDSGATWNELNRFAFSYTAVAVDPSDPTTLFACDDGWGIYRSEDRGMEWKEKIQQVSVTCFAINQQKPEVIFAGAKTGNYEKGGILKTTDRGEHWKRMTDDPGITALAIDPSAQDVIYAASSKNGVLKSVDGGVSWRATNSGLTNRTVRTLVIHPTDSKIVYVGTWEGGVFRSENGGETWSPQNQGLGNPYVASLVIDPKEPSRLYVSTKTGIYQWAPAPIVKVSKPVVAAPAPKPAPAQKSTQTTPVAAKPLRRVLKGGNHPPVINPPFRSVQQYNYDDYGRMIGVVLTLSVDASDPDGDPLIYTWTATTGTIVGTGSEVQWTPPIEMGTPASGVVTVVVSDGKGGKVAHRFAVGR
jgi:photosystem II stability/assembly factor-like uncharacterized protein